MAGDSAAEGALARLQTNFVFRLLRWARGLSRSGLVSLTAPDGNPFIVDVACYYSLSGEFFAQWSLPIITTISRIRKMISTSSEDVASSEALVKLLYKGQDLGDGETLLQISDAPRVELSLIRLLSRNFLEQYCFRLLNLLSEDKFVREMDDNDHVKVKQGVQETLDWLDQSQLASNDELEAKQKELEGTVNPIMMKFYKADIGVWGAHLESIGVGILRGRPPTSYDCHIINKNFQTKPTSNSLSCFVDRDYLGAPARNALMRVADRKHSPGQHDLQITLSIVELTDIIGEHSVSTILAMFPSRIDKIILRRVEATSEKHVINFHTDVSLWTMQIALNSELEYEGGRLLYVNTDRIHQPVRHAGSVTIHDNSVPHGVSEMVSGVRYGLLCITCYLQLSTTASRGSTNS